MSWNRKYSFLDDEACEDDSRNIDFGLDDLSEEEEDDFLDEKHILNNLTDQDEISTEGYSSPIPWNNTNRAKRTRSKNSTLPTRRLSNSKIIKIKNEEDENEVGWDSDELDDLMQNITTPRLTSKKFRIVPSSLRLVIPQDPIIVFPRSSHSLSSIYSKKVFIGIDPGVRNLGVSVAIPDLLYFRNSTHAIVKNTLQTSFDYNSVSTMIAIAVKVESILEEEVLNVIAGLNSDYVWDDLVLCIEAQYVLSSAGPKTMLFQRLILLGCRLEMSFLDWSVRKQKGLHIQRTSSQRTSSIFLKGRPHLWNIIMELNKQIPSRIPKNQFTMDYQSSILEDLSKLAKKQKAVRVVNLMFEIQQGFAVLPHIEWPEFAKLPFASALTDHEADANLSLVTAILDILKVQNSKQC